MFHLTCKDRRKQQYTMVIIGQLYKWVPTICVATTRSWLGRAPMPRHIVTHLCWVQVPRVMGSQASPVARGGFENSWHPLIILTVFIEFLADPFR